MRIYNWTEIELQLSALIFLSQVSVLCFVSSRQKLDVEDRFCNFYHTNADVSFVLFCNCFMVHSFPVFSFFVKSSLALTAY